MIVSQWYALEVCDIDDHSYYQVGGNCDTLEAARNYRDRNWKYRLDKRKKVPSHRIVKCVIEKGVVE